MGNAFEDLVWYFQSREAALGLHGASSEPGSGGLVFDDEASWRAHERMHECGADVRRMRRVEAALRCAGQEVAKTLACALTPWGHDEILNKRFQWRNQPVAGLAIVIGAKELGESVLAFRQKASELARGGPRCAALEALSGRTRAALELAEREYSAHFARIQKQESDDAAWVGPEYLLPGER